jgi:hypothetical protein
MANNINNAEEVILQDGTKVLVKPLTIKNLRKFMEVVKKFEKIKNDEDGLDLMVEATQIALMAVDPKKFEDKEYLEDVLDITTIGKIMQVAGGVDINQDPNSLTATV